MTDKPKTCLNCIWLSSGYNDARGAGFCYSEGDYVDEDGHCDFWRASLRDEPVNTPERRLVERVAELDTGIDDAVVEISEYEALEALKG